MMYFIASIVLYLLVSRMLTQDEAGDQSMIAPRSPEEFGQQEPSYRRY